MTKQANAASAKRIWIQSAVSLEKTLVSTSMSVPGTGIENTPQAQNEPTSASNNVPPKPSAFTPALRFVGRRPKNMEIQLRIDAPQLLLFIGSLVLSVKNLFILSHHIHINC